MSTFHESVLLNEAISSLKLLENSYIVDATLGYAGHSSNILERINKGYLFAFDQDSEAIIYSTEKLKKIRDNFTIFHCNFSNMKEKLNEIGVDTVDGILFDLGVSSPQLDNKSRGFSYNYDARLDMRMNKDSKLTAWDVINKYQEKDLERIFYEYAESKFAKKLAKKIVLERSKKTIDTTFELNEVIQQVIPFKEKIKKHPSKTIFQAIRIEVNNELEVLKKALIDACSMLKVNGRCVVITFHSLEDRIVKNIFKELTSTNHILKGDPNLPIDLLPSYRLVNKKVILPSLDEISNNRRSKSAKLRVIERIKE